MSSPPFTATAARARRRTGQDRAGPAHDHPSRRPLAIPGPLVDAIGCDVSAAGDRNGNNMTRTRPASEQ